MEVNIRKANPNDVDSILEVQAFCYQNVLLESREVLLKKILLFPDGCYLVECYSANAGYILSHPWRVACPPAINYYIENIPNDVDCYYIHDLAVLPKARGHGIASKLLQQTMSFAKKSGFSKIALVSVENSAEFWESKGFIEVPLEDSPQIADILKTYQKNAKYMCRTL
jgi:N-acetylglutamate synthase-like GNAT family acetyltransferase